MGHRRSGFRLAQTYPADHTSALVDPVRLNDYEIINPISSCAAIKTYHGRSLRFKSDFTIKIYASDHSGSSAIVELHALRVLSHPSVVSLYDAFEWNHRQVLVLDYYPGGTLQDELAGDPGPCSRSRFLLIARQLLMAVEHCHAKGIYHGAITPESVLFRDAERTVAKLGCFSAHGLQERGEMPRRAEFEPPEGCSGASEAEAQKDRDVWMLGVTLAYLANGHSPWLTDELETVLQWSEVWLYPALDVEVQDVVRGLLRPAGLRRSVSDTLALPVFQGEAAAPRLRCSLTAPGQVRAGLCPLARRSRRRFASQKDATVSAPSLPLILPPRRVATDGVVVRTVVDSLR